MVADKKLTYFRRLPKVEEAKPKRIAIKVTPQPKVIEAKTK